MQLPEITHLQFLVLNCLTGQERPGLQIRQRLTAAAVRQSGPAFYRMMARLEDASMVEGYYVQEVIDGQVIKQRHYRLSPQGRRSWDSTRRFYLESFRPSELEKEKARA
ncbi:MAG: hypothetical protein V3T83_18085 [Acidobacteriota bacterium]